MISLITGQPGAGKTLWSITNVQAEAEKSGRAVYYYGIKGLKLPWILLDDPAKWYDTPTGSIIVIDEAQVCFRVRAAGSVVPTHVAKLEDHRHRGQDLFLITQHPMLMDTNVRRLVGRHFHVVRNFGMHRATVHEWAEVREQADKSRAGSIRHEWTYPTSTFSLYHSAEVHTHKRRLPMRLFVLIAVPFAIAGCVYATVTWWGGKSKTDVVPAASTAAVSPSTIGRSPKNDLSAQGAVAYVASFQPRVESLAYTAPRYDEATKPITAPVPVACVASRRKCSCYSQQGTRLDVAQDLCRDLASRGFFLDFELRASSQSQRPAEPQQRARVLQDAPPATLEPVPPTVLAREPAPLPAPPVVIPDAHRIRTVNRETDGAQRRPL